MTIGKGWLVAFLLLFVLSLAANFFVGGLILGRQTFQPEPSAAAIEGRPAIRRFMETLPDEARPAFRRALRDQRREFIGTLRDIRAARTHVSEVLGQTELDDDALAEALSRLRARTAALQTLAHGIMMEAAKELPAEVRAKLRTNWQGGPPRRPSPPRN